MDKITDRTGLILAAVALVLSWGLFYKETGLLWNSFFAACLTAGSTWITYILLRWLYLALKGEE